MPRKPVTSDLVQQFYVKPSPKTPPVRRRPISAADTSMNNPPEVNRQAVKAEAEARKMQAALNAYRSNRAALKQNAPEQNRKFKERAAMFQRAKVADDRIQAYRSQRDFGY